LIGGRSIPAETSPRTRCITIPLLTNKLTNNAPREPFLHVGTSQACRNSLNRAFRGRLAAVLNPLVEGVLGTCGPCVLPVETYGYVDWRPLRFVRFHRQLLCAVGAPWPSLESSSVLDLSTSGRILHGPPTPVFVSRRPAFFIRRTGLAYRAIRFVERGGRRPEGACFFDCWYNEVMADNDRRSRAEARRRTAILRKTTLHDAEGDLSYVDGAAAVSLVGTLTRESWAASRRKWPTYTRSQIPVRFIPGRPT
jgi:hypothetical protein